MISGNSGHRRGFLLRLDHHDFEDGQVISQNFFMKAFFCLLLFLSFIERALSLFVLLVPIFRYFLSFSLFVSVFSSFK
jgi:hypothetical protein